MNMPADRAKNLFIMIVDDGNEHILHLFRDRAQFVVWMTKREPKRFTKGVEKLFLEKGSVKLMVVAKETKTVIDEEWYEFDWDAEDEESVSEFEDLTKVDHTQEV